MRFKPPHECNLEKLENVSCCCQYIDHHADWSKLSLVPRSNFQMGLGTKLAVTHALSNSQCQLLSVSSNAESDWHCEMERAWLGEYLGLPFTIEV